MLHESSLRITFILSSPRSGSTWLRLMLNDHPQIASGEETFLFTDWAGIHNMVSAYNREKGYMGLTSYIDEDFLYSSIHQFASSIFHEFLRKENKQVLVEKSIRHALFIPTICRIYPQASFIHLYRDGRDCSISISEAAKSWNPDWPRSIKRAAHLWSRYNHAIIKDSSLIDSNNFISVRYEDMLSNCKGTLASIFHFLQVDTDETIVQSIVNNNTFSVYKKEKGWLDGNFFRKGISGQWQDRFTENDKVHFKSVANDMLVSLGYEDDGQW